MKLSIIIPCFNEKNTLNEIIKRVNSSDTCGLEKEIIIIDDASTDGSPEILQKIINENTNIKLIQHENNQGKGKSLQDGFANATGDLILIQDADLEYNPDEYPKLLKPIIKNNADVVYGSRFIGGDSHRVLYFWHSVLNKFLTTISNMFTNLNLTDMEVCYKVFKKDILDKIKLNEKRFGFEPEITIKISRLNCIIYEVGISYYGRTYNEGKKISWKDGMRALYVILKYGLFRFN